MSEGSASRARFGPGEPVVTSTFEHTSRAEPFPPILTPPQKEGCPLCSREGSRTGVSSTSSSFCSLSPVYPGEEESLSGWGTQATCPGEKSSRPGRLCILSALPSCSLSLSGLKARLTAPCPDQPSSYLLGLHLAISWA